MTRHILLRSYQSSDTSFAINFKKKLKKTIFQFCKVIYSSNVNMLEFFLYVCMTYLCFNICILLKLTKLKPLSLCSSFDQIYIIFIKLYLRHCKITDHD